MSDQTGGYFGPNPGRTPKSARPGEKFVQTGPAMSGVTLAEFARENGCQPHEMAAYLDFGTNYTDDMVLSAEVLAAGRESIAAENAANNTTPAPLPQRTPDAPAQPFNPWNKSGAPNGTDVCAEGHELCAAHPHPVSAGTMVTVTIPGPITYNVARYENRGNPVFKVMRNSLVVATYTDEDIAYVVCDTLRKAQISEA